MTVYKVSGVQGELEVFEDRLVLTPKGVLGFMNHGVKGAKTIPFSSITATQFKEAGLTSGYIQFSLLGGQESKRGILSAAQDENSFMYAKKADNAAVQQVKSYVEARMGAARPIGAQGASRVGLADELTKLAGLRDQQLLSEEEFQRAKARLMGSGAPAPTVAVAPPEPTRAPVREPTPALAQPVAAAPKTKSKLPWLILGVFFLMGLAAAFPWLGIVMAMALAGVAVAVITKKIPLSPFARFVGIPEERRNFVVAMSAGEILLGLLLLLIGVGSLGAKEQAAERDVIERQSQEEAARRDAIAQKALTERLTAEVPAVIDHSKATIEETRTLLLDADKMEQAKTKAAAALTVLRRHEAVAAGNIEFAAIMRTLTSIESAASKAIAFDALGKQLQGLLHEADDLVHAGTYIEADDAYAAAVALNAKMKASRSEYDSEMVRRTIEKARKQIAKKVAQAKASLVADEKRRARQFRLGEFYYWIDEPTFKQCISTAFSRTCAGAGGTFVIVPYTIENMGKETKTIMKGDFEIQDSAGRTFRTSSQVETALLMSGGSKDFILSELNPGVQKSLKVGFEIPENATGLKLVVPEKGAFGFARREMPLD